MGAPNTTTLGYLDALGAGLMPIVGQFVDVSSVGQQWWQIPIGLPIECVHVQNCILATDESEIYSYPVALVTAIFFGVYTFVVSNKAEGQTLLPQYAAIFYVCNCLLLQSADIFFYIGWPQYFSLPNYQKISDLENQTIVRSLAYSFDFLSRASVLLCLYRFYHDYSAILNCKVSRRASIMSQDDDDGNRVSVLDDSNIIGHVLNFSEPSPVKFPVILMILGQFGLLVYNIYSQSFGTPWFGEQLFYTLDIIWLIPLAMFFHFFWSSNRTKLATGLTPFLYNRMKIALIGIIVLSILQTLFWSINASVYIADFNHIYFTTFYGARLVSLEIFAGSLDQMAYQLEKSMRSTTSGSTSQSKRTANNSKASNVASSVNGASSVGEKSNV